MSRYLLACALLLFVLGCSKTETAKGSGGAKPVMMPNAATENGDGPPEKDLPKVLDLPLYPD